MVLLVESISEVAPCPLTPSQVIFPAGAFPLVIQFIFYYVVNSLCRTLVLPTARCLELKAN